MELNELYRHLLEAADLVVSEDGHVSYVNDKTSKTMPLTINGKRLVLPYTDNLKAANGSENTIRFHPLCESMMAGESVVLNRYREALMDTINRKYMVLFTTLLYIGGSVAEHKKIPQSDSGILSVLKNVDKKTLEDFKKILEAIPAQQTREAFIKLYIKKNGNYKGKTMRRLAVVWFPLYEEILKDEPVRGVKLRKVDRATLKALFEYVFPNIQEASSFDYGSTSNLAPSIDALMGAVQMICDPLNIMSEVFLKDNEELKEKCQIQSAWCEAFQDIDGMTSEARQVPMQPGNEGKDAKVEQGVVAEPTVVEAVQPVTVAPAPVAPPQVSYPPVPTYPPQYQQPPYGYPPPQPTHSNGQVSIDQVLAATGGVNYMYGYGQPNYQQQSLGGFGQSRAEGPSGWYPGGYGYNNGYGRGSL